MRLCGICKNKTHNKHFCIECEERLVVQRKKIKQILERKGKKVKS